MAWSRKSIFAVVLCIAFFVYLFAERHLAFAAYAVYDNGNGERLLSGCHAGVRVLHATSAAARYAAAAAALLCAFFKNGHIRQAWAKADGSAGTLRRGVFAVVEQSFGI